MEELLSLKWNNHKSTFLHILTVLRDKQMYTDATLACEGKFYSVHKLVLSTCSDYFSAMFDRIDNTNPIIVLKDIKCVDLEALLDYMYLGEVNVKQSELSSLIKSAECLQVKGLAVPDDEPPKKSHRKADSHGSPPAKRKRKEDEDTSSHVHKSSKKQPLLNSEDSLSNSGHTGISHPSTSDISDMDKVFVKIEKDDSVIEDNYENNTTYKVENNDEAQDSGGDISNELPEYLPGDDPFHEQSYGESSFQQGDVEWPEGSNFSGQMNFPGAEGNASGDTTNCEESEGAVKCSVCGRIFKGNNRKGLLSRHLSTIHFQNRQHSCPLCDFKCTRKDSMTRHIKNIHANVLADN